MERLLQLFKELKRFNCNKIISNIIKKNRNSYN